jgi:hypothetical protein
VRSLPGDLDSAASEEQEGVDKLEQKVCRSPKIQANPELTSFVYDVKI